MNIVADLTDALRIAGVPVEGVALLGANARVQPGWVVVPNGEQLVRLDGPLTAAQLALAEAVVAAFDPSEEAARGRDEARHPERTALRRQAAAVIRANDEFLALASPTPPQVLAQLVQLTQCSTTLIRRLAQLD